MADRRTPPTDGGAGDPDDAVRNATDSSFSIGEMPGVGELDYIWGAVKRALLVATIVLAISIFAPQIIDQLLEVLSQAERLRTIRAEWFVVMVLAEILSFASLWWLMKILLPKLSWFVAATSQLTSNSVSRVFPGGGGAAAGGATLYRMLAVSGTNPTQAGGALAAMSLLSTAALAAIPVIGAAIAVFGAPIPEGISPIAIASGAFCVLLLIAGVLALRTTTPLVVVAGAVGKIIGIAGRVLRKDWTVETANIVLERDRLANLLGKNWPQATAASALNWTFDYLVLVFALYAVDAEPRLSLVMIAYASGAVLSMISITPGGFGFVEVGLVGVLTLSGIPSDAAGVAVLAYRGVSLWLPIASGLFAWLAFRVRFPRRSEADTSSPAGQSRN